MKMRTIAAPTLVAALALSSLAAGASASEPSDTADPAATSKSVTGVISEGTSADGRPAYFLTPEVGEPIELSYGPSWAYGDASPLHHFVGSEVTVIGQLRDGVPNDNASDMVQADGTPMLHVRAIVGAELRGPGRPPWAGGPKVVGEVHPGYAGWSEGQAARAEEQAADALEKAAEKAEAAQERAAEKAQRAADKAATKAARAEMKSAVKAQRTAQRAAAKSERAAANSNRR